MSTKIRRVRATSLPSNPRPDTLYEVGGRLYLGGVAVSAGGGSARLTLPVPYVDPAVTAEAVTVSFGPSSQANANSEYSALGTPTYRFDQLSGIAASARRVELDGLIQLRVRNDGVSAFFESGVTVIGGVTQYSAGSGAIRFVTMAQTVTLVMTPNAVFSARILVDGCRLAGSNSAGVVSGSVSTTSNAPNWIVLTFPDERQRVISFEGVNLKSIFLSNSRYASPPFVQRPKLLVCGDSFAQRVSATGEGSFFGSLGRLAGRAAGLNTVNIAQGGTGYVNPGSHYNYQSGIEWLAANGGGYAPDYLLLYGTGNDATFSASLQAKVSDTIRAALAAYPNLKKIICTGCYGGFSTDAVAADLSARIKSGAEAVGDSRVVYVPVHTPETDDPMFTGTGSVPSPANDGGNADLYFSNSTQGAGDRHPNRAGVIYGADYIARRLYSAITGAAL